jgi:hypothetical protein
MAEHIIDAFLVKFGIDRSEYNDGVRDITDGNKRLREGSKKTFDEMEHLGRKTGESIKGVTREVIGLGLAFMGARSITGFLGNMATGAASADRFGKTLGMSIQQVWAWRQAMKSVGGDIGDGDAALQAVQNAKSGFKFGTMAPDQQAAYGRLGVSGGDLRNADAGAILSKLSGAADKMDPQVYASLLQQIGLPQSTIYFLQQGKDSVDKLLKQYEANSKDAETAAKQSEELQKQMAELNTQLTKALLPVLNQIVPILTQLVTILGGTIPGAPKAGGGSGEGKSWGIPGLFEFKSSGSKGKTRADRNNNPGNIEYGAFARAHGAIGSDGRFAKFASPEHGFAAMEALLGGSAYMGSGRNTIMSILSKYAPASENHVGAYAAHVSKLTGIGVRQTLSRDQLAAVARAMAVHEGYSGGRQAHLSAMAAMHSNIGRYSGRGGGNVTVGTINVHTKATDARGIARDIHGAMNKRMAVAQADRVVNP